MGKSLARRSAFVKYSLNLLREFKFLATKTCSYRSVHFISSVLALLLVVNGEVESVQYFDNRARQNLPEARNVHRGSVRAVPC